MLLSFSPYTELDLGLIFSMVCVLGLTASVYISIGLYCSALFDNYFTCAIVCLIILLTLSFILGFLAKEYPWIDWLILGSRTKDFYAGLIDTRHIAYFVTLSIAFLFLTHQKLEKSRTFN